MYKQKEIKKSSSVEVDTIENNVRYVIRALKKDVRHYYYNPVSKLGFVEYSPAETSRTLLNWLAEYKIYYTTISFEQENKTIRIHFSSDEKN